jgi:hypothetical protein
LGYAVVSVVLGANLIVGVSFSRDERRAEQVLGDDDPITVTDLRSPGSLNPDVAASA